ncbi:hypothetical protein [Saccharothrix texasensis]|uniref:hypothetical protein n=1 Tax=Saccharothrix texasensis TaxID=103734 RepID=UPI0011CD3743|nr:hypothetical protein [Saccharothrix texasensis]
MTRTDLPSPDQRGRREGVVRVRGADHQVVAVLRVPAAMAVDRAGMHDTAIEGFGFQASVWVA